LRRAGSGCTVPRMRNASWRVAAALAVALGMGCGDDSSAKEDAGLIVLFDATPPPPDAFVCVGMMCGETCIDTTSDPFHCGMCDHTCSPASECADSECQCPAAFLPASVDDPDANVGSFGGSMNVYARTTITGTDGLEHRVTVGFDPAAVPIDTDLDLATTTAASMRVRYNTTFTGPSGSFTAISGTMHLTRACAEGVTGTITGVALAETEGGPGGGTAIPDGCGFEGVSLSFDLGPACGSSIDAGIPDAGTPDGG